MTREMISEVRMEALHPDARSAHPAAGLRQIRAHGRGPSPLGVLIVCSLEIFWVDELLESVHAALALEATHSAVELGVHEPVQGWHWSAISQVRFVFDHDRAAVVAANYDRESSGERSTEERFNNMLVVEGRVAKRQRQNSSVRTRRDTNPARWLDFGVDFATASGVEAVGDTSGWNPGSDELAVTSPAEFSGSTCIKP